MRLRNGYALKTLSTSFNRIYKKLNRKFYSMGHIPMLFLLNIKEI
ncbi:hypothetical protein TwortDSMZ_097 [Staphylococcus phage Twort]|uniref:ORF286 n=2 Tax=Staphylococcus phage Twort (strain DSM 17442 / HER 48) TaxID=2908167 RepID=Q4Z9F9_BPTWO|nr:ORF286 [Staphylococcus phage Twort]AAX92479.1 ORF286 [Staphylococcus phage Twort]QIW89205.1 hypothetical protein TwortDSMZ_097 [Staphylococcus phage Twort]